MIKTKLCPETSENNKSNHMKGSKALCFLLSGLKFYSLIPIHQAEKNSPAFQRRTVFSPLLFTRFNEIHLGADAKGRDWLPKEAAHSLQHRWGVVFILRANMKAINPFFLQFFSYFCKVSKCVNITSMFKTIVDHSSYQQIPP